MSLPSGRTVGKGSLSLILIFCFSFKLVLVLCSIVLAKTDCYGPTKVSDLKEATSIVNFVPLHSGPNVPSPVDRLLSLISLKNANTTLMLCQFLWTNSLLSCCKKFERPQCFLFHTFYQHILTLYCLHILTMTTI